MCTFRLLTNLLSVSSLNAKHYILVRKNCGFNSSADCSSVLSLLSCSGIAKHLHVSCCRLYALSVSRTCVLCSKVAFGGIHLSCVMSSRHSTAWLLCTPPSSSDFSSPCSVPRPSSPKECALLFLGHACALHSCKTLYFQPEASCEQPACLFEYVSHRPHGQPGPPSS